MGAFRRAPVAWLLPALLLLAFATPALAAPPAAPTLTGTSPASPANDNQPEVLGSSTDSSAVAVLIYHSSDCSGSGAGVDREAFNASGATQSVGDNTTTFFSAKARNAGFEDSDCSNSISYTEDSIAPATPTNLATSPLSPANDNNPELTGTTDANTTIDVYANGFCTGSPVTSGTTGQGFGPSGITLTVANDSSTTFSAKARDLAGNPSGCSTSITYVEDSTPPNAPVLNDTDPDSPADDHQPEVKGFSGGGSPSHVRIYQNANCSGDTYTEGTIAAFTGSGITVTVPQNQTTQLSAKARDAAGNVSTACSPFSISYTEVSTPPAAPSNLTTTPASPSSDETPLVRGSAPGAETVRVYKDANCTDPYTEGSAAAFTGSGIEVTVPNDQTTALSARSVDQTGLLSDCSTSIDYVEDSTAPGAPTVTATTPASPANDDTPLVKGTVGSGSPTHVRVYETSDCSGGFTLGTADDFTGSGIEVTVAEDQTTALSAKTVDQAGNVSAACSNTIDYVEQSTAPGTPTITDSDPDSPANDNSPEIKGTADPNSTVKLYRTVGCTGSPVAQGTAAQFASPGITVAGLAEDQGARFRATATNAAGVSGCSAPFDYVEDSTSFAPTVSDTDPESPANNNNPKILGTAFEQNVTIKLYTNDTCTSSVAGTGSGTTFNSPGITVTVGNDTTTTFWATATDQANNVSGCSDTSVSFTEDSTPPAAPTITATTPASPANDDTPLVKGTVGGGDPTHVRIYETADCTGPSTASGTVAEFTGSGIEVQVTEDATTPLSARTVDAADNASTACSNSINYVEQSTPPVTPTITDSDPDSPANDNAPEIKGGAESNSTVKLYTTADCTGDPVAEGPSATFLSPGITVNVAADTTITLRATATNAAGTSGCSAPFQYTEDSTPPAAPSNVTSVPPSPANNNNPRIKGTADAGTATVHVYKNGDCSGSPAVSGTRAEFISSGAGLAISVEDDTTTQITARAVDQAGNPSACSARPAVPGDPNDPEDPGIPAVPPYTYVEDSTRPGPVSITSTDPPSGSNNNFPRLRGTADDDTFSVRIYRTPDCTGAPATITTGLATAFEDPNPGGGIAVNVNDDTTTQFSAKARDRAGNESVACSNSITYVEQSSGNAPAAPTFSDTDPDSPANENNPEIKGAAPPGTTVVLYRTPDCTLAQDETPAGAGSAEQFAAGGITVNVADNSTTTFYAQAVNASSEVSACSSNSITYVEDSIAPGAPTITATDPTSPANDSTPLVKGTAANGNPSHVRVYETADCTGDFTEGTADAFTGSGIEVTVTEDATTALSAKTVDQAGNVSTACSNTIDYREDSQAPAAPTITATTPASPSSDETPLVKGTTGAGDPTRVRVYETSDCSGDYTEGSVADFTGAGIEVTVAQDATTALSARTVDQAGNPSTACSNTIDYTEDSTAPGAPTNLTTVPASPANDNSPEVKGTAPRDAVLVRVYKTADCTGGFTEGSAGDFTGTGITINVTGDQTTPISARALDQAGNPSDCSGSIDYVEDSTPPSAPVLNDTDPDSPANDHQPEVKGVSGGGSPSHVRVYETSDCTGDYTEGTIAEFTGSGITVTVAEDQTTQLSARAVDAASNVSAGCSNTISYREDSQAPAPPTNLTTVPASPANDNSPRVKGQVSTGDPTHVRVYKNSDCSGNSFTEGTVADFTTGSGIAISVSGDQTTAISARTVDQAGNPSTCSTPIDYREDSIRPDPPNITATTPPSPGNDNDPEFKGTAEDNSTVKLYTTSDCSGTPVASGTAASFADSGFTVHVDDNTPITVRATATDAASNVSDCSSPRTYVEDSNNPAKPSITDTDPDSPANDDNPEVKGTAEEDSTVAIYKNGDCSGSPAGSGGEDTFETTGITVNVSENAFTTFTARATDAAGNPSPCSDPFVYREDSTLPAMPTVDDTDPDSPANDNDPEVKGTAPDFSVVQIFTNSACSGSAAASGTDTQYEGAGITVHVNDNTTTTFYARTINGAGVSDCSQTSKTYREDSDKPNRPTFTGTTPTSPGNDTQPEIKGSAEDDSTVRLYTNSTCTSAVAGQGSASNFANPGLTVSVPDNESRTYYATATDQAANVSDCSTASITYEEDSTNPNPPTLTGTTPASPANANTANKLAPKVKGTAENGSTVRLYKTADCTGPADATGSEDDFSSTGLTVTVADNATTRIRGTATDAAGNPSDCSDFLAYTVDSTAPAASTSLATVPASPSSDNTPNVKGTAEQDSTVAVYSTSDCSGTPAATGGALAYTNQGLEVTVPSDSTTTFRAVVTDVAGNKSSCQDSGTVTYVEDSTNPGAPTIASIASPANDNSIEVKGTTGGGDPTQVKLYRNANCTGSPTTTVPVATFTGSGIAQTVSDDTTTDFSARTTDAAGNDSACSSKMTYVEDSTAPAAPNIDDLDPDSPANDNTVQVKGSGGEGNLTIEVYETDDCSGDAVTGNLATFSGSGITVTVDDDSTTDLSARAVDLAGNESDCSDAVQYVEDSAGPAAPAINDLDPDSPSNDNSPEVKGTVGAGTPVQVRLYENADCSGSPEATGTVAQFAGAGITADLPSDATSRISARAVDGVGNQSSCSNSVEYLEDSTAPKIEIKTPADGASFVQRDGVNADYSCSDSGSGLAEGDDGCRGTVGVGQPIDTIALGTRSFNVSARDRVGNTSEASTSFSVSPTTSTTLDCTPSPARIDQVMTCTALVRRNDTGASGTPTGTVTLTGLPNDDPTQCTLAPGSTPGSASCELSYTPTTGAAEGQLLTARYGGDATSAPSAGTFVLSLLTMSIVENRTMNFASDGSAFLPMTCESEAGDCTGTVEIRSGNPPAGRLAKAQKKSAVLGRGSFKIKRGKRGNVKVKLTRSARAQLKKKKKQKAYAVIKGRQGKGPVRTSTVRVNLRSR